MELADVRIRLAKDGSDVPKFNITPAEALIQHILHQNQNGGSTFGEDMDKIKVTGEAKGKDGKPRTDVEELRRLQGIYGHLTNKKGDKLVRIIFPDTINPKLPQKFSDLNWKEVLYDGTDISSFDYGTSGGAAITQK